MIGQLKQRLLESTDVRTALDAAGMLTAGQVVTIGGVAGSLDALLLALLSEQSGRQLLVVVADRSSAERLRDDMQVALGAAAVRLFDGSLVYHASDGSRNPGDVEAVRSLLTENPPVTVTHPGGVLAGLPHPADLEGKSITLIAGQLADPAAIVRQLGDRGFTRADFTVSCGDFAVRGGIVDVFPYVGENPVRIEFFGETIESIREFDPASQRSIRELDVATIVPDLLTVGDGGSVRSTASIIDFVGPETIVVVHQPELVTAELALRPASGSHSAEEFGRRVESFARLNVSAMRGAIGQGLDLKATAHPAFNGSIGVLRDAMDELIRTSYKIWIGCDTHQEMLRLKDLLHTIGGEPGQEVKESEEIRQRLETVDFSLEALHEGFVIPSMGIAVFTEHQIFNRLKRHGGKRRKTFRGFTQQEVQLLRRGDFVVHEDYGIGRFDGLRKIHVRNLEQEVVRVAYHGSDVLYVNLNYVNKLQKYSSKEGHIPKLTRLGSPDWDRLKSRAKKKVKDIARELIALYAKRKSVAGFTFPGDSPWQQELEASFLFEDTFDQAKATTDVKRDMEQPYPMDRLICGDVGFGKTEVAVRGAFKAVLAGKQVAVLVPTTILATQHYNTFRDRMGRYGVNVQVVSRFKPQKEQRAVLGALRDGAADVVIGTHRLLSKDVSFKNLGLLIIDEEHRFGVSAKERLRQKRAEVDTLSLTATPIPRTLHFSLMGARDLSVIATPPRNRLPIVTELAQWKDDLVQDAILREIRRGGQVYVVHDRVQSIDEMTDRLRSLVPTLSVRSAHGQMHAHELEEVMVDFLEKRIDVLVTTKIIESGLDIPNVNTIIVNRADRFGMAELYQLRGRVGRSNVQAYAFLLTPPMSVLPRSTIQRLQALQEFTELGSGFNLAMRDLEIRGAGNLLGSEQSGFIETMGFETYTRILEEAVRELKEDEFQNLFSDVDSTRRPTRATVVEPEFEALLPETYVENDVERLSIYRRLYGLETAAQLKEIAAELTDRFGKFPEEVQNLFITINIRIAAARRGFRKVKIFADMLEIDLPPEDETSFYEGKSFEQLMTAVSSMRTRGARLKQEGKSLKLLTRIGDVQSGKHPLQSALEMIDSLPLE